MRTPSESASRSPARSRTSSQVVEEHGTTSPPRSARRRCHLSFGRAREEWFEWMRTCTNVGFVISVHILVAYTNTLLTTLHLSKTPSVNSSIFLSTLILINGVKKFECQHHFKY